MVKGPNTASRREVCADSEPQGTAATAKGDGDDHRPVARPADSTRKASGRRRIPGGRTGRRLAHDVLRGAYGVTVTGNDEIGVNRFTVPGCVSAAYSVYTPGGLPAGNGM